MTYLDFSTGAAFVYDCDENQKNLVTPTFSFPNNKFSFLCMYIIGMGNTAEVLRLVLWGSPILITENYSLSQADMAQSFLLRLKILKKKKEKKSFKLRSK